MTKFKLEKTNEIAEVKISASGEQWKSLIDKSKKKLIDNLELKGFRKGKVPLNIANKNISMEEVRNNASSLLLDINYEKAIDLLAKENIATRPQFSILKISDNEVEIALKSILMPEVKLGNMDSINVEYKKKKINEKELKEEVDKINKYLIENKEISNKDAVIKKGNIVNINYLGKVNGKPFDGGEGKDFDLEIGSKSFVDNFEDQLIGMKKGEEKIVNVKFPDEYPAKNLKGKKATFDVKINAIKEKITLSGKALQEKLETLGFDSKEEIILRIKDSFEDRIKNEANDIFFRKYMEEIMKLKDTVIKVPEEIVKQQVDEEWKRIEMQVQQQGMKVEDYLKMLGMPKKEFKQKNLKEASRKRVKEGLVYSKLISDFKIKVTKEELENEYMKLAILNKTTVEDIKKEVSNNSLEQNIIFEKLINKLKK